MRGRIPKTNGCGTLRLNINAKQVARFNEMRLAVGMTQPELLAFLMDKGASHVQREALRRAKAIK